MNIFVSPDTIELNPPSLSVWGRSWEKENISEGKEKIQFPFMVLLYKVNCKIISYWKIITKNFVKYEVRIYLILSLRDVD